MVARGYTSATLVAQELGFDLTAPQLDQAADLIESAEAEIDSETGQSWLNVSPVTGELHTITGPYVYLNNKPVVAITSATVRGQYPGAVAQALVSGTNYELIDAANGILAVSGYGYPRDIVINTDYSGFDHYLLSVSYTHTPTINPAIRKIATELVAHWMRARVTGSQATGIKSYTLPDLSVTYADSSGLDIPDDLMRRIRSFERLIIA